MHTQTGIQVKQIDWLISLILTFTLLSCLNLAAIEHINTWEDINNFYWQKHLEQSDLNSLFIDNVQITADHHYCAMRLFSSRQTCMVYSCRQKH